MSNTQNEPAVLGPVERPVRPGYEARPPDAGPLICWRAGERVCTMEQALAYRAEGVAAERERCAVLVETQDTYGDSVGCWFETLAAKIRA